MKELIKPNVINDELHLIENYCEGSHCSHCLLLGCDCFGVDLTSIEKDDDILL
jgi:hypothetical protein